MPTKVVHESRKLHGAGKASGGNGQSGAQRSGDGKMQLVSQEIMRLLDASRDGRLTERGKVEQFDGIYREMVQGVNEMLDAILLPIGEGNRILAQISTGKIDELIAQTYKGDHEKMKQGDQQYRGRSAGPAEGDGAPDRRFQGRAAFRPRQTGAVPGRLRGNRARREHHAGRHPAADWGRQPHSHPGFERQDRRTDCPDL
jgi:hypothetical protein